MCNTLYHLAPITYVTFLWEATNSSKSLPYVWSASTMSRLCTVRETEVSYGRLVRLVLTLDTCNSATGRSGKKNQIKKELIHWNHVEQMWYTCKTMYGQCDSLLLKISHRTYMKRKFSILQVFVNLENKCDMVYQQMRAKI